MESACFSNDIGSGLHHEVIGVAEHELQADGVDGGVVESFEGAIGADGDKAWGIDGAVRGVDFSDTGVGFFRAVDELKAA